VFSTPIKLVMPTPGQTGVSNLVIYFYNGEEWILGCDASGNSLIDGWMVPGSRVNDADSIELKIWHFSGVQVALVDRSPAGGGGNTRDDEGDPEEDVAECFIKTILD